MQGAWSEADAQLFCCMWCRRAVCALGARLLSCSVPGRSAAVLCAHGAWSGAYVMDVRTRVLCALHMGEEGVSKGG